MRWTVKESDTGSFELLGEQKNTYLLFASEADLRAYLRMKMGPADQVYHMEPDGYLVRDTSVGRRRHWRGR